MILFTFISLVKILEKGYTINVLDLAKKLGYDDPGSMDNTMFSDGRNEFVKFSSYDKRKSILCQFTHP